MPSVYIPKKKKVIRCRVKECGWALPRDTKTFMCGPSDSPSCWGRRKNIRAVDVSNVDRATLEYRVLTCDKCRFTPTYKDVCLLHLFREPAYSLAERWEITMAALYAVRKRRKSVYRRELHDHKLLGRTHCRRPKVVEDAYANAIV